MFRLVQQVFMALLGFTGSLVAKSMSLNNESYIARDTITDLSF